MEGNVLDKDVTLVFYFRSLRSWKQLQNAAGIHHTLLEGFIFSEKKIKAETFRQQAVVWTKHTTWLYFPPKTPPRFNFSKKIHVFCCITVFCDYCFLLSFFSFFSLQNLPKTLMLNSSHSLSLLLKKTSLSAIAKLICSLKKC